MSGVPDEDSSIGLQASPSHGNGDRRLRATPRSRARPPAHGDGPGAGHPAPVPARRHALAQPDRRSLTATEDQASGSTLRRCLADWAETGLLAKVHALLVRMLRGPPDLILDSCSVRAKRGGDLTGPNPTDRGKQGTNTT